MELHPLDQARLDADTAVSEALGELPAARIAEMALAQQLKPDDPRPTEAEALAYLEAHKPSEDGPLGEAYARVAAAQKLQSAAHAAWRDLLVSLQD
jgi:hypothetical protein